MLQSWSAAARIHRFPTLAMLCEEEYQRARLARPCRRIRSYNYSSPMHQRLFEPSNIVDASNSPPPEEDKKKSPTGIQVEYCHRLSQETSTLLTSPSSNLNPRFYRPDATGRKDVTLRDGEIRTGWSTLGRAQLNCQF
jgi:hypothetical protein